MMNQAGIVAIALCLLGCGSSDGESGSSAGSGGQGGSGQGGSSVGGSGGASSGGSSGSTAGAGGSAGTAGGSAGSTSTPVSSDECASPEPDWIFCADFESGTKDEWDDYDGNPDDTNLVLPDVGPSGSADNLVMRFRVPEGRNGADLVKVLPETHQRLYARWYIKYETGFDFSAANHGGGLHAGDRDWLGHSDTRPDGSDWFTSWVDYLPDEKIFDIYAYYRGMYQDCADPNGSCWGDHFPCVYDDGSNYCEKAQHRETVMPPTLQQDQWYCVEILADGGTPTSSEAGANGELDMWIDDLQIGPWNDLWLRTTADLEVSILWLNLFHHAEHSVEGVMYDNVVVSKSRIGCQ
jgi:hypothetical protein